MANTLVLTGGLRSPAQLGLFHRLTAAVRRELRLRRAEAELRWLDDRELADMGLRREDIRAAVRGGLTRG